MNKTKIAEAEKKQLEELKAAMIRYQIPITCAEQADGTYEFTYRNSPDVYGNRKQRVFSINYEEKIVNYGAEIKVDQAWAYHIYDSLLRELRMLESTLKPGFGIVDRESGKTEMYSVNPVSL